MRKKTSKVLKRNLQVSQLVKPEYYNGEVWQTLSSENYVNDTALTICWDLLNDDTEVIWQPL
jgi:hypothetical protein